MPLAFVFILLTTIMPKFFRGFKIFYSGVVLLAVIFLMQASAQNWVSLNGPQIAKNVKDISVVQTGTDAGNVWYIAENDYVQKSTNGGTAWFVTATPYSTPSLVLCKPNDITKVVAAKNGYLHYNSQGGSGVWVEIINDPNLIPLRLVAAANNPSVMLLGRKNNVEGTKSIWRSENGGSVWGAVNSFTPTTDINDFSAIPTTSASWQSGTIWAAGSSNVSPPPSFNKTAIAETRGLWISEDYGQTWPYNKLGGINVTSVALVPRASYYDVYASGSSSGNDTLYKLTDYPNNNWTSIFCGTADIRMVRFNKNNNTIFLATNDGVYRSTDAATTDGGGTWTKMTGLTDLNVQVITISGSNTVFAGTANSLYKSTDNGSTWTDVGEMNSSSVAISGGTVWPVSRDNNYQGKYNTSWTNVFVGGAGAGFRSEHVLFKSSTDLFVAGALNNAASLYRSTNSGDSYFQVAVSNPLPTSGKFLGTVKNPDNNEMWLYGGGSINGTWRMLLKSTDGGDNWTIMSPYWQTNDLYVNDLIVCSSRLFAASSDGKVYRSDDNGVSWGSPAALDMGIGYAAQAVALNPSQPTTVYAGGTNGIWKSTNNGSSFSQLTTFGAKRILMHPSYPNSANHLWIISADGQNIYKTADGGNSWAAINTNALPKPINDIRRDPTNNTLIYVATAGGVYNIDPAPEAPSNVTKNITYNSHPRIDWAANAESDVQYYDVYKWECQTTLYLKCIGDPVGTQVATTTSTHYIDYSERVTFYGQPGDIRLGYYAAARDNHSSSEFSETKYFYQEEGYSMEKALMQPIVENRPTRYMFETNYPNPFNPATTIKYALPEDIHVMLRVYDVLGREVAVLVDEVQKANWYEVKFDAAKLPSGVYFYKFNSGKFSKVSKMLLAK